MTYLTTSIARVTYLSILIIITFMVSIVQEWTTIPVSKSMAARLRERGKKGDRYEDILNRLLSGVDYNEVDRR